MTPTDTLALDRDVRSLQCLEVWGGNQNMDADVAVTGLDVCVRARTWRDQPEGGDIYLVSMCACAKISRFMLADVAGHGEHAGQLAHRLRQIMHKHINKPDQTRLATALNREFARYSGEGRFATALLVTYQPDNDELIICNAGHPPPLWYRSKAARWQRLDPVHHEEVASLMNLPFGVVPGTAYQQFSVQLAPNDAVLLLSDGLTEAEVGRESSQPPGTVYDALSTVCVEPGEPLSTDAVTDRMSEALAQDHDDRTMILLSHNGADPPVQSLREKMSVLGRMVGLPT